MSSSLTYQCAFLTSLVEFERNTCTLLRSGILFLSFANSAECVSESALARPTSLTDCFSPSVWTAVYLSNWVRSEARTPGHTTLHHPALAASNRLLLPKIPGFNSSGPAHESHVIRFLATHAVNSLAKERGN